MTNIWLEVILVLLLVLANGVFAMAEMAVVSARKARLRQRADEGRGGAAAALELAERPHNFLSTVQVGITLIGTLAGAFGGATIAKNLSVYLQRYPSLAAYSETIGITAVVIGISYLSLILGELVPKNLALSNPEGIASVLAPAMRRLARLGSPAVAFLTFSTNLVIKLLPFKPASEEPVTEEEVKVLMAQGTEYGTFEEAEQEMVEGVFRLGDRRAIDLMRPRSRVTWLDAQDSWDTQREIVRRSEYSRFPVGDGDLDRVIGTVHVKALFRDWDKGETPNLRTISSKPLLIPELTPALELLEQMQQTGDQMALIVDEHGVVQGIVTLTDLFEGILGDLRGPGAIPQPQITRRDDGSWLADGSLPITDMLRVLGLRQIPGNAAGFNTAGGWFLAHFNQIPKPGDHVIADGWRLEVVDMDRHRIDKILISRILV